VPGGGGEDQVEPLPRGGPPVLEPCLDDVGAKALKVAARGRGLSLSSAGIVMLGLIPSLAAAGNGTPTGSSTTPATEDLPQP
jgi:hypothetical protein